MQSSLLSVSTRWHSWIIRFKLPELPLNVSFHPPFLDSHFFPSIIHFHLFTFCHMHLMCSIINTVTATPTAGLVSRSDSTVPTWVKLNQPHAKHQLPGCSRWDEQEQCWGYQLSRSTAIAVNVHVCLHDGIPPPSIHLTTGFFNVHLDFSMVTNENPAAAAAIHW